MWDLTVLKLGQLGVSHPNSMSPRKWTESQWVEVMRWQIPLSIKTALFNCQRYSETEWCIFRRG